MRFNLLRALFTYVTATVHLFELIQVGLYGSQVLLLHITEEVLDGYSGHLYRRSGVHDGCLAPRHPGAEKYPA